MFGHRAKITDEIFFFAVDKCLSQKQTGAHTQTIIIKKKGNIIIKKTQTKVNFWLSKVSLSYFFFQKQFDPKNGGQKTRPASFFALLGRQNSRTFFLFAISIAPPRKKKNRKEENRR
jgi:hypothetical protein